MRGWVPGCWQKHCWIWCRRGKLRENWWPDCGNCPAPKQQDRRCFTICRNGSMSLPCLRMRNDYLPVHTGSGWMQKQRWNMWNRKNFVFPKEILTVWSRWWPQQSVWSSCRSVRWSVRYYMKDLNVSQRRMAKNRCRCRRHCTFWWIQVLHCSGWSGMEPG